MTIEQPTSQDYGTWRCSVGVQQWIDNAIRQQSPMQALISVTPTGRTSKIDCSTIDIYSSVCTYCLVNMDMCIALVMMRETKQ